MRPKTQLHTVNGVHSDFDLDEQKTLALWRRWQEQGGLVKESLCQFAQVLTEAAAGKEPAGSDS